MISYRKIFIINTEAIEHNTKTLKNIDCNTKTISDSTIKSANLSKLKNKIKKEYRNELKKPLNYLSGII